MFINTYLWCHKTFGRTRLGPSAYRSVNAHSSAWITATLCRPSEQTATSRANLFQCGLRDFCYRASPAAIFTVRAAERPPFSSLQPQPTPFSRPDPLPAPSPSPSSHDRHPQRLMKFSTARLETAATWQCEGDGTGWQRVVGQGCVGETWIDQSPGGRLNRSSKRPPSLVPSEPTQRSTANYGDAATTEERRREAAGWCRPERTGAADGRTTGPTNRPDGIQTQRLIPSLPRHSLPMLPRCICTYSLYDTISALSHHAHHAANKLQNIHVHYKI